MVRTAGSSGALGEMPVFRPRRTTPATVVTTFAQQLSAFGGVKAAPPQVLARPPVPPRAVVARPAAGTRSPTPGPGAAAPAAAPSGRAGAPAPPRAPSPATGAPPTPERAAILARADAMLGIPYVWGGDTLKGLDCSSYLSRAWGVSRQTTDTLSRVADPITKEQLQPGDAMNMPTWRDPEGYGHVRIFEKWANPERTKVWVYEETAETGKVVHRVVPYNDRYQPMRLRSLSA